MLNLQYYNTVLKKNHLSKILNNYKLKYSRVVNEIESKIHEMMKLCLNDIFAFLESLEDISEQKHKITEYDKNKRELEIIKQKLKSKDYHELKLKNDFDLLQQENNLLKLKISSLNKKINNYKTLNINNNQNNINSEKNNSSRYNRSMPKINNASIIEDNFINKSTLSSKSHKKDYNKNAKIIIKPKINNNYYINQKKKNHANKFVNNKLVKSVKNRNIKLKNINDNLGSTYDKKFDNYSSNSGPINNKLNNNNKNGSKNKKLKNSCSLELNNVNHYSPLNSFNQSIELPNSNLNINYNDLEKNLNEALDSEIKELEQDQANIELLLEQLGGENEDSIL